MKNKTKNFIRQKQMRSETVSRLVECISRGVDTKRKLMAETGFSWGSVATITTELLDCGVIEEFEVKDDRRTSHYHLTREEYYALGIELANSRIFFSLATADGTLLERFVFEINSIDNDNCCKNIKAAYGEFNKFSKYDSDKILITVCTLTGAVDSENLLWLFSPHHPAVSRCSLAELQGVLPGKMKIEHGITAKARSIFFHHKIENKSSVFIHVGEGVGLASYSEGKFFTGSRGFSGEIGHIPFAGNPDAVCRCGKKGCLECSLSLSVLHKQGVAALHDPMVFLGVAAVNLYDPEYLVIGGEAVEEMFSVDEEYWKCKLRAGSWLNAPENILFYRMNDCLTSYGAALGCRKELVDMITESVCC